MKNELEYHIFVTKHWKGHHWNVPLELQYVVFFQVFFSLVVRSCKYMYGSILRCNAKFSGCVTPNPKPSIPQLYDIWMLFMHSTKNPLMSHPIQLPAFEFVKVTHPNTVVAPNSSRSSPTPGHPSRPRPPWASWPKGCWHSGYWPTPLSRDRRCKGSPSKNGAWYTS